MLIGRFWYNYAIRCGMMLPSTNINSVTNHNMQMALINNTNRRNYWAKKIWKGIRKGLKYPNTTE